ncbi:MAG: cation transporter [Phycisphaerales bacterium]|nr:MAG: cation transporter [Phycisphaerales bacterium]
MRTFGIDSEEALRALEAMLRRLSRDGMVWGGRAIHATSAIIPLMARGSRKVIYAALVGNAGIALTKFIAAAITGSSAMFAEAVHSVVDTGNQLLLLWGLKQASRPPDEQFPLGHGKEVYFWSFVVAILIFAVGAGVSLYEGIKHVLAPRTVEHVGVSYVVLTVAMMFEGGAWWFALRGFRATKGDRGYLEAVRRGKDPTMFVVLLEDSAALLGLMVAFVGIGLGQFTGSPYFDGAASIVIGLILGAVAGLLAWETKGLLIGEAADRNVQRRIREIVSGRPEIKQVNELITMHMGPESILVNLSVDFADELPGNAVEAVVAELNRQIKLAIPGVCRVFIEAESWAAHHHQQQELRERPANASPSHE